MATIMVQAQRITNTKFEDVKFLKNVIVDLNKQVDISQEMFLKNGSNKTILISILSENLRENGFIIFQAKGDVDTLIVKSAIQQAEDGSSVAVHADDVDIFCMLMHHCREVQGEVNFKTIKKNNGNCQTWKMSEINKDLASLFWKIYCFSCLEWM